MELRNLLETDGKILTLTQVDLKGGRGPDDLEAIKRQEAYKYDC
jgi:hypothetical protein